MKTKIEDLSKMGHVRPSVSPWGTPVLFMKKKKIEVYVCVLTIESWTSVQFVLSIFKDRLVRVLQLRIRVEDISETTFRTRYGHFWIPANAIWVNGHSHSIHGFDGLGIPWVFRSVHRRFYWWYIGIFKEFEKHMNIV